MPQTTQQLKADIDHGRTGDKVASGFDPGLSTLGTDDEAAGTPNTPQQVAMARGLEQQKAGSSSASSSRPLVTLGGPAMWIIVGAIVVVVAVLAFAVLHTGG